MKKMKEKYEKAEMEIIEFETEDVITTSGDGSSDIRSGIIIDGDGD